jgi:ketosteroid isomerase-like protein
MAEQDTTRSDLPAIGAVIDAIMKAVRTNDVEAFLRHCAPEMVVFDMLPPLQQKGWDAFRGSWGLALASFEGPIEYEVDHLDIHVSGDVAFSRSLAHFGGTTKEGNHVMNHLRTTIGFRKVGGAWKVLHQHVSVPFDMSNGRALLNLDG